MRECEVRDLADEVFAPNLIEHGFTTVRLPERAGLRSHLESVRRKGALDGSDEAAIRRSLHRARVSLPDGAQLLVLHVADEGMIFRAAGPDAIAVDGSGPARRATFLLRVSSCQLVVLDGSLRPIVTP